MSERRFEIVANTRRRWSREEKQAIVEEASGLCANVSAVARRHGLNPALLYRWKKELGAIDQERPTLLPVAIVPETPTDKVDIKPDQATEIEIVLGNGRRICVRQDIDSAALKRILDAAD